MNIDGRNHCVIKKPIGKLYKLYVNVNNTLYITASFILDNLLLHEIDIVKKKSRRNYLGVFDNKM